MILNNFDLCISDNMYIIIITVKRSGCLCLIVVLYCIHSCMLELQVPFDFGIDYCLMKYGNKVCLIEKVNDEIVTKNNGCTGSLGLLRI